MATPEKVAALARMKLIATVLFVAVTVLFVVARLEGWPWVAAFAEAAMIGALADWFAVVALFRRPLGLPIPHTAILPRNKARLADNLAIFIRDRFLDTQSLVARLRAAQPADRIAAWLQDENNARLLADRLAVLLAESLDFMDDKRVRRLVLHALRRRAGTLDLAGGVGRIMDVLTEDGRHQALLDEGLRKLAAWLDDPAVKEGFAGMIVDVASKEYPKVVSMLGLVGINPAELGEKVSVGIVAGVNGLLDEVAATRSTRAAPPSTNWLPATSNASSTTRLSGCASSRSSATSSPTPALRPTCTSCGTNCATGSPATWAALIPACAARSRRPPRPLASAWPATRPCAIRSMSTSSTPSKALPPSCATDSRATSPAPCAPGTTKTSCARSNTALAATCSSSA
jgi:hypothetical protein